MGDFEYYRAMTLQSRDIRVKLLYRNIDVNYLWKEYDIEFPNLDCNLTEYGEIYIKDGTQVTNTIKKFLKEEELQDINSIHLQTKYIGSIGDITIVANVLANKYVIRQLRIEEIK